MILLIEGQNGEIETITNVVSIGERKTPYSRTLIMARKEGHEQHEGEIDLNLAKVTVLPND